MVRALARPSLPATSAASALGRSMNVVYVGLNRQWCEAAGSPDLHNRATVCSAQDSGLEAWIVLSYPRNRLLGFRSASTNCSSNIQHNTLTHAVNVLSPSAALYHSVPPLPGWLMP